MILALKTCPNLLAGRTLPGKTTLRYAAVAALIVFGAIAAARSYLGVASSPAEASSPISQTTFQRARLSEWISVRAAGRGGSMMSLGDGHELLSPYKGPVELQRALEQNEAHAHSLASADFDEDGVPDLAGGYAYRSGGIVTVHRGNSDSIYPNAPEAQARKANGTFTAAPFLSPALAIEVTTPADFLGAGDFDADGHWDIVLASRGGKSLSLLAGDGKGNFEAEREIQLNGGITAFATGELNRRDGLTDVLVGLDGSDGPQVCIFEGPLGAMRSSPEILSLPVAATSFALGEIDGDYPIDLVAAAGNRLMIIHGRDRKLSLSEAEQSTVPSAHLTERVFDFHLQSVAIGDFSGDGFKDLAVLSMDGAVRVLTQPAVSQEVWAETKREVENYASGGHSRFTSQATAVDRPLRILPAFRLDAWKLSTVSDQRWVGTELLIVTRLSSVSADTLVLLNPKAQRLDVVAKAEEPAEETRAGNGGKSPPLTWQTLSLDSSATPTAVLPMRLDSDALSDLVVAREQAAQPSILFTQASERGNSPDAAQYATFTNPAFFFISAFFETPGKSSPYPSTIEVSGVSDPNSKIRVKLHDFGSNKPSVVDLLLVSPGGQKVMLMSDAGGSALVCCVNMTFDDAASGFMPSVPASGSFKPSNIDDGSADVLPSPAPSPPYAATLAAFNGNNLDGTWSLFGIDDGGGGTSIQSRLEHGWTLIFGDDPPPQDFVVTNINDSGTGSLRKAILDANAKPGADRIIFSIGSGPQAIALQSILPQVSEAVTIDATTQPGFAGVPIVEINGANAGSATGLSFTGGNSVVRGLVVNRFSSSGIVMVEGSNNIIEGNYVGISMAGTSDLGNGGDGIALDTANNRVGGTTNPARNVISGNQGDGIFFGTFFSDLAENNLIQGNYVGTNAAGTGLIRNEFNGISTNSAPGSPNNVVGGTVAGARNVIAGSIFNRVDITYPGSSGTLVQGNYIGTDVTGTVDLDGTSGGNSGNGVELSAGVGDCLIGGTTPAARNIISGNWYGVQLNTSNTGSPPPARNLIQGNFIGTNVNGNVALKNLFSGVFLLFGATQNTIGGTVVEARNIISGNNKAGIQIGDINRAATFTNIIQNNYIGIDVTGNNPLPNGNGVDPSGGIIIPANADGDRIERNRIAYNIGSGIRITNVSGNDTPGIRILIIDNEIFSNTGLGIDLGNQGITQNDALDADSGPNLLQNFPVLTSAALTTFEDSLAMRDSRGGAVTAAGPEATNAVTVSGTLSSTPNTAFTVHWYFSGDSQCVTNQASSRPLAAGKIPGVTTDGSGNAPFTFPFDFPTGINTGIINCTATDPQGNTSEFSACLPVNQSTSPPVVQFSAASYNKSESGPSTNITVTRTGNTSGVSSVNFGTGNNSYVACNQINGTAVQNCDFILSSGTLNFGAGQTSRTFPVIITDDWYQEGNETVVLTLSSPSGAVLGTQTTATLMLVDNDSGTPTTNPLDDPQFYVRQHYYDFLGRLPDDGGLSYWTNEITICGTNTACVNERRVAVSNAFFYEQEYQQTASYVFLLYRAAYGNNQPFPNPDPGNVTEAKKLPRYLTFVRDRAQVVGGSELAQTQLALANAFVQRPEFIAKYPLSLATGTDFVNAVLVTIQSADGATLALADRNTLITHFSNGGRGLVMFHLANDYWNGCHRLPGSPAAPCVPAGFGTAVDNRPFIDAEYNRSFVYSQYSGYLRRDGDIGGFIFWLTEVSKSPPRNVPRQRAMVCSFMTSTEYQHRLSPVATHNNGECPPPP